MRYHVRFEAYLWSAQSVAARVGTSDLFDAGAFTEVELLLNGRQTSLVRIARGSTGLEARSSSHFQGKQNAGALDTDCWKSTCTMDLWIDEYAVVAAVVDGLNTLNLRTDDLGGVFLHSIALLPDTNVLPTDRVRNPLTLRARAELTTRVGGPVTIPFEVRSADSRVDGVTQIRAFAASPDVMVTAQPTLAANWRRRSSSSIEVIAQRQGRYPIIVARSGVNDPSVVVQLVVRA